MGTVPIVTGQICFELFLLGNSLAAQVPGVVGFQVDFNRADRTGSRALRWRSALYSLTSPSLYLITFTFISACLLPKDHRHRSRVVSHYGLMTVFV